MRSHPARSIAKGRSAALSLGQSRPTVTARTWRMGLCSVAAFPRAPNAAFTIPGEAYRAYAFAASIANLGDIAAVALEQRVALLSREFQRSPPVE